MQNSKTNHKHRKHPPTARPVNKLDAAGPENHHPTPTAAIARQAPAEPEGRHAASTATVATPAVPPPQEQPSAATETMPAVSPPEKQPPVTTETIQALDRLGEKLDKAAALLQQQLEAWRQTPATAAPRPPQPEAPAGAAVREPETGRGVSIAETRPARQPAPIPETTEGENIPATPPGPPENGAAANLAGDARRLLDTLSRSQGSWREPLADLRQALDAIMGYLENQAAAGPPPIDVSDIMSRLKNLEEEQKNLQSQFSTSR